MLNYATAIYVADTYDTTAEEQVEMLLKFIHSNKPNKIYLEKKGYETHNTNRQALQMLIEDIENRCINEIFVIDYEVFFGSAGNAAELYRVLKKIKGLELLDLSLLNIINNADEKHSDEIEQMASFPFAYEAYIAKFLPTPKRKKVEKETLIYVMYTDDDFLTLDEKVSACAGLADEGAKLKVIIDDYTNKNAEQLGHFEVMSAIEDGNVDTLIVYELGSVALSLEEYEAFLNKLSCYNLTLKSVKDIETPCVSTISSPGFGFCEY